MEKNAPLVAEKPDPELRCRAVATFILQAIPWAIYPAALAVDQIVVSAADISSDTRTAFIYAAWIALGATVVIMAFGFLVSCRRISDALTTILIVVYYAAFAALSVTFAFVEAASVRGNYALALGLPLLILTVGHLLWAIFYRTRPFHIVFSGCLMGFSVICGMVVLVVHSLASGGHYYLFGECVGIAVFQALLSASWITAVRHSLGLLYSP